MYYIHVSILVVLFNTALTQVNDDQDVVTHPCTNDEFCETELPGSKCVEHICKCVTEDCGEVDTSIPVTKIGLPCKTMIDCLINNAECVLEGNVTECRCFQGMVPTDDGKKCLKPSGALNETCVDTVQCSNIKNSECRKGLCKCKNGTKPRGGACYYNKALGADCEENDDCKSIQYSECFGNKCVCSKNYVKGRAGCLLAATDLDSSCLEDGQCSWNLGDGATCLQNKCVCRDVFHYKEETRKCVQHLMLSSNCTEDDDCYKRPDDEEYMACVSNICKCKESYKEFEDNCVAMATTIRSVLSIILSTFLCLYLF